MDATTTPDRYQVREYDDDRSGRVFRVETFDDPDRAAARCRALRGAGHEADVAGVYATPGGERTRTLEVAR